MVEIDTKELVGTTRCTICRCSLFYLILIANKEYLVCHDCGQVTEKTNMGLKS